MRKKKVKIYLKKINTQSSEAIIVSYSEVIILIPEAIIEFKSKKKFKSKK